MPAAKKGKAAAGNDKKTIYLRLEDDVFDKIEEERARRQKQDGIKLSLNAVATAVLRRGLGL